jgi:hypothetical protein
VQQKTPGRLKRQRPEEVLQQALLVLLRLPWQLSRVLPQ